ncbi:protein tyrosine phosphatase type IVA 1 [Sphaeroforma arctica JP610]|uniref:protein-tyrosine-phosphatase n=1 Tax=Sphaeroforma arctica JP610 TaxID=667725 RepID=A0A0L0G9Q5_9EUKA|nr:protein tyrosine phosphatase type IVA 1 [Sphaeroforma arctica JP610]KNC85596.1 protein tyrosine phosphatase type IVA 1 [Sphaeroforma arctica JP610]|eukprot:XP_014159498.1 protein tyrosine phosphatase type IVA 1 [Sphaeroforma arctica JP610]
MNPISVVEHKGMRFVIMDAPSNSNLPSYLQELKRNGVQHVVRVCDPTYEIELLEREGIQVHDWSFPDGESPPSWVITNWLAIVQPGCRLAIHCVAGLGRAPVLVAVALMENGVEAEDAVAMIRKGRRGAINSKQLRFLQKYKPRGSAQGCCIIL